MQPRPVYTRFVRSVARPVQVSWDARMSDRTLLLGDDVQARRPATLVSLSRVGVTGVEKVVRIQVERQRAALLRRARVLRGPRPGAEGRAHVALRGGRERGDRRGRARRGVQGGDARLAHRRARARPPGRLPRRGDDRRALPGEQARAGLGRADAGDLHAVRVGGGVRARHAPAGRRAGAGHDRLPVRAGDGDASARRSGCARTASPTTRSPASSRRCRWPPTTSAASARSTSAAPRAATPRWRPTDLLAIVEASMSSEIYELMKRPDEVEVVEKAHRRPRFVEDCVREMVRMAAERYAALGEQRLHLGAPGEPRDDPQAQRRGRAPRPRRRARRARSRRASASGRHVTAREWLEGA